MSEENKKNVEVTTKKSGMFGWVKNIVSAVIGAAISFGVTIGIVSADQEKQLNERLNNINAKAGEVVTALNSKDVNSAIAKAKEIVEETKAVKKVAKEVIAETKEKVQEKTKKVKETAEQAKGNISKTVENKPTK